MKKGFTVLVYALSLVAPSAFADSNPAELLVRFRTPQTVMSLRANSQLVNGEYGVVKMRFASAEQAEAARQELLAQSDVESVAPNLLYKPAIRYRLQDADTSEAATAFFLPFASDVGAKKPKPKPKVIPEVQLPGAVTEGADPLFTQDWAVPSIGLDKIADLRGSAELTAAVIDTGVDYNHEDLNGAMWRSGTDARVVGWDFAHDTSKPYDVMHFDVKGCFKDPSCKMGMNTEKFLVNPGHGTHCAGHVGAIANNSLGLRGVGAGVKVMGLKFFYDFGEANAGQGDDAAAIKSIDYAIKNGVKVISASWGGHSTAAEADKSELKVALERARDAGVIFVVASGNESMDQDSNEQPSYPAAYHMDNMIVVAASDKDDSLAEFSNYGAKTVDLAAPGVKILSTTVGSQYSDVVAKFTDSSGKTHEMDWDGTSMATPIVAGAVALVWSQHPSEDYHQIRDRILNNVRKVAGLAGKTVTGGVLDVAAAVK
ncbi:MAG: S8 family peptidase [Bdellovibrionota bacterium]